MSERAAKKDHLQQTTHSSTLIKPWEERYDRANFENTLDIEQFSDFSDLESSSYLSEEKSDNYTQIKRKIRTDQGQQVNQGNSSATQISTDKNLTLSMLINLRILTSISRQWIWANKSLRSMRISIWLANSTVCTVWNCPRNVTTKSTLHSAVKWGRSAPQSLKLRLNWIDTTTHCIIMCAKIRHAMTIG